MQETKDEQYERVIKRAEELKDKREKVREEAREESTEEVNIKNNLNNRQFVTGLVSGEIRDVEMNDGRRKRLILDIKTNNGKEVTVKVRDTGRYTEDNPVARLLEWKDISDGRIDDLIGENVKLVSNRKYPRKRDGLRDSDWDLYIPHTLDKPGKAIFRLDGMLRRVGLHSLDKTVHEGRDSGLFPILMGLLLWVAIGNVLAMVLLPLGILSMNIYLISVVVMTIFFPAIANYAYEGWERYKDYREKDSIKQSLD